MVFHKLITALLLGLILAISGCSSKENFIVLSPGQDGSVGALQISNEEGSAVLDQQGQVVFISGAGSAPSAPEAMDPATQDDIFRQALEVHPKAPLSVLLYFELNADSLTEESNNKLPGIISAIKERMSTDVTVIGHTDRTGGKEYNQELSMKRAREVAGLLRQLGVEPGSITITYHGEGNPLVPTADDVAEPRNRRVEVLVR